MLNSFKMLCLTNIPALVTLELAVGLVQAIHLADRDAADLVLADFVAGERNAVLDYDLSSDWDDLVLAVSGAGDSAADPDALLKVASRVVDVDAGHAANLILLRRPGSSSQCASC